jgi:hypothetical protein
MDFVQIDELLGKLKKLERQESCYEWEIKHTEQRLKDTVDAKLLVFKALAGYGIRNTFDLKDYLTLRKRQTGVGGLLDRKEAIS